MKRQGLITLLGTGIFLFFIPFQIQAMKLEHPNYLHALSDLRAARWMIEHRPGNWQTTVDEEEAVRRIDAAINEIKRASIDDGKDIYDHPRMDEHPDRGGRLHDALDFLLKAREDVNREEDNRFADGLQGRALMHINEAINATNRAIASLMPQPQHPAYLHALSDLRAARWMIDHRPGNWQTTVDEEEAVRRIDAAINEIKRASIDDGKDIYDHPSMDEHPDRGGRLHDALDFLLKAREDVNREEDNRFADGLQGRALMHINEAINATNRAIASLMPQPQHPAYMHALSDLRAARWMLEHRPGNWDISMDEMEAIGRIEKAIKEIKNAAIDDGKDINDHPQMDEHPDHRGRLHDAADFLKRAREDVNAPENNGYVQGLQERAMIHINEAIRIVEHAMERF